jgi:hypothetical protein
MLLNPLCFSASYAALHAKTNLCPLTQLSASASKILMLLCSLCRFACKTKHSEQKMSEANFTIRIDFAIDFIDTFVASIN